MAPTPGKPIDYMEPVAEDWTKEYGRTPIQQVFYSTAAPNTAGAMSFSAAAVLSQTGDKL